MTQENTLLFARSGLKSLPNLWDAAALILVLGVLVLMSYGSRGMTAPLNAPETAALSLDYWQLPYYALRTTLRMFAAMIASLIFTFTYATLAAKSRRAEMVLIPLLDVLQSVPILGFLSFTVTFFLGLFPGSDAWRGMRGDLRDLHQPGLEHGLLVLSVAAHACRTISTRSRAAFASRPGRDSGSSKRPSPCRASSGTR